MTSLTSSQVSTVIKDPASVDAAIESRFSARAFLPRPVEREVLADLLRVASRAPSGTNTQPWQVYVLQGARKDELVRTICEAHDAISVDPQLATEYREEYDYYPEKWISPYIDRRRECGFGLYGVLGIGKGDRDKMHAQHQRNFRFLQSIMLAARARGLHTCPQAAWNGFSKIILPYIGARENEMLVCGMALGYADESALVNTFQTTRVAAKSFTHWIE